MEPHSDDEIDILDLLIVVAKHKKMILRNTFIAAVIAIIYSLLLTKIYTASTTILPPQQSQSTATAMLGQLGGLAGMAGASLGIKNPADLYIGMLKSSNVQDDLVKRFNLKALYNAKIDEDARKALQGSTVVSAGKDGFIKIEFSDKDPKRAAEIANAYVDELDRVTSGLAVTEASQRRLFFETQLNSVKENLAKAEYDLQQMQAKSGMIQDYPQEKEIAESNAMLRAQISAKEVQLSAMGIGVTQSNPEYLRLKQEIASLKDRLKGADAADVSSPAMSKESLEYIEKFRNVKYDQAVLEMLFKQYEAAKIDEAKDYPVIQVLDRAVPPERKSKPKRALIVMLSTVTAFMISILWAFFRDAAEKANSDPERSGKVRELKAMLFIRKKRASV